MVGCATLETETEFAAGRQALLTGDAGSALNNFSRVGSANAQYVTTYSVIPQSIWTYTGRAYYTNGQYKEARTALEKALAQRSNDHMARLYIGMTSVRLPVENNAGFTAEEVVFALKEGIEPERIVTLMRQRGVAFAVNRDTEQELRKAGANQALLDGARKIGAARAKPGGQDLKLAKGALAAGFEGLLATLNYTVNQTNEGRYWDPNGEIRKQLQTGLQLLSQPQPQWDQIVATGEWVGKRLEEEIDLARRNEADDARRRLGR